jgi:hypothetical protein
VTKGLNTNQVKELNGAWHHATRIGRPLNVLISVRPLDIDAMPPAERCRAFASFRNRLGVYARHRRFPPTYVGSREINHDGTGEHMHVLMHVPPKHRSHFDDTSAPSRHTTRMLSRPSLPRANTVSSSPLTGVASRRRPGTATAPTPQWPTSPLPGSPPATSGPKPPA